ncbi:MAG: hypothetical protein ABI867_35710 [Kofleriaceae bacterium]
MKPSPIASILMFVGAAFLLFALFSTGWFTHSDKESSMAIGILRSEMCFDGHCQSNILFSNMGRIGPELLLLLGVLLFSLTAVIMAIIAGFKLFKPGRTALAVLALAFAGAAALMLILMLLKAGGMGGASFGYAFYMFWLGAISAITASVMAMMRPRAPSAMMRPGMPGMQPMYGAPPQGMYPPQYGAPQQGGYGAPMQQQQPPMQQPMQMQQHPMGAPQGAACPTCQTPTTWVAQYNRWFCQRCNKYP